MMFNPLDMPALDCTESPAPNPLATAFAQCFAAPGGAEVMAHLRRLFLDRRLSPPAADAELWHLEGQRSAVAYIFALAARGGARSEASDR